MSHFPAHLHFSLAAVSTLYFVEHNKKQQHLEDLRSIQLSYVYNDLSLNEEELLRHNMLNSNRTSFTYHSSADGLARSQRQNSTKPYRGELPGPSDVFNLFDTNVDLVVPPTSQQSVRSDEIPVVIEKPSISHELLQPYKEPQRTTTSPLIRSNKTVNSKHKNKWPQPDADPRVIQTVTNRNALTSSRAVEGGQINEENRVTVHNVSETTTEKISDVNLVQQDFEHNSIDTDSQQTVNRHKTASNTKKRLPPALSEGSLRDILKLSVDTPAASTSSSINEAGLRELNSPTQLNNLKHTNSRAGDLKIYKTVPPPTSAATTTVQTHTLSANKVNTDAPQTNYSLETQPISNKSRNYVERNPDNSDNDLQSLTSNTNESIFNSGDPVDFDLGQSHSSAVVNGNQQLPTGQSVWMKSTTEYVETFGEPEQCNNKVKSEDISNCQVS